MDTATSVRTIRQIGHASIRELSALSGVAKSMITSIEAGKANPTAETLTRLLTPLGYAVTATPVTQPGAIAAARKASTPDWPGAWPDGADDWTNRFRRLGWLDPDGLVLPAKKTDLLFRAGLANWTDHRPGRQFFTSPDNASWIDIVVALGAAGIEYALTGGCAVNNRMPVGGGLDPILYVPDIDKAAGALDLVPDPRGHVTLLPYNGVCEVGAHVAPGGIHVQDVRMVTLEQLIIDCVALPKAGLDQAEYLTGRRV